MRGFIKGEAGKDGEPAPWKSALEEPADDGEQDAHDDAGDDREMQGDAAASEADVPRQQSATGAETWTDPPDHGAERGHRKPDHDENPSQTLHVGNRVPATPQAQPPILRRGWAETPDVVSHKCLRWRPRLLTPV